MIQHPGNGIRQFFFFSALLCQVFLFQSGWSALSSEALASKSNEYQRGYRFPALKVRFTQYRKHWRLYIRKLNFTSLVGRRPFMMLYYQPGHAPSEVELVAFDKMCRILKGKMGCLAIAPIRRFRDIRRIYKRLKALQIKLRVLLDSKHLLSYITLTKRLPSYSAVSKSGFLRLVNAASLTEQVAPGKTLLRVIRHLATGKDMQFIRAPGFSPNPFSKVGAKVLSFRLPNVVHRGHLSSEKLFEKSRKKPVFMLFWSISCGHCRRVIPVLDQLSRRHKKLFSIVTFVQADKASERRRLKQFIKQQKIQMTVCLAPKGKLFDQYHALLVPTLLLVDQTGTLRDAHVGVGRQIEKTLMRMLANLPSSR